MPAHPNESIGAPENVAYRALGVKGYASGFATLDTQFPVCSPAAKPNMDRPCPACAPLTTSPMLAGAHLFGALLLHFSVDKHTIPEIPDEISIEVFILGNTSILQGSKKQETIEYII